MDKNTASGLTAQLQEVLKIADEYGKQSKQFAQAKNDLLELVEKVSMSNDTVVELIAQCEKYLSSAQTVIEGDYFEEIKTCIKDAKEIEEELKSNNEASVVRLERRIGQAEANAKQFHESQQDKAEKNRESIETMLTSTMTDLGKKVQANEVLLSKIAEETHKEQRKASRFRIFVLAGLIALGVITVVLLVLRIVGV